MPTPRRMDEVTLRLVVRRPAPGASMRVQRGATTARELVDPVATSAEAMLFELRLGVRERPDGTLELRGPEVQGSADGRFIYVNSGMYAGEIVSEGRRAKVPLHDLRSETIARALAHPGSVIAGEIDGRARDGGPAAATVPLLGTGWTLVEGRA
jgi:hypothetical protein